MILLGPLALLAAIVADRLNELDAEGAVRRAAEHSGSRGPRCRLRPELRVFALRWSDRSDDWMPDAGHWRPLRDHLRQSEAPPELELLLEQLVGPRGLGAVPSDDYLVNPDCPTGASLRQAARHAGVQLRGGHGFWHARAGGWLLRAEGWTESCLDEGGVGPWGWRYLAPDEEGEIDYDATDESVPPEGPDQLEVMVAEADLRIAALPPGAPDGAPDGAARWVADVWTPGERGSPHPVTQLTLWKLAPAR